MMLNLTNNLEKLHYNNNEIIFLVHQLCKNGKTQKRVKQEDEETIKLIT